MGASNWRGLPIGRLGALLVATLVCLGCSDEGESGTNEEAEPVELENGEFVYECVSTGDIMCPEELTAEEFPEQVATGSLFDVSFTPAEETESSISIRSGSDEYLEASGSAFRAVQAGKGVLIAKRDLDDVSLGFAHLTVVDMASVQLAQRSGDPAKILMVVGDQQELRATPVSEAEATLGGAIDFTWTSSDESVIRPAFASPTSFMTVLAAGAGEATITVSGNGQTADLTIAVVAE